MTTKVYEENDGDFEVACDTFNSKLLPPKKLIVIPRDPHPEEIYSHADGMVRFIKQNYLLVNSQYPKAFKQKLHKQLKRSGFKTTELKVKEDTKYVWDCINFLHLDDLIIQPLYR